MPRRNEANDEAVDLSRISLSSGARRLLHTILTQYLSEMTGFAQELVDAISPGTTLGQSASPPRPVAARALPLPKRPTDQTGRFPCSECGHTYKSQQLVARHKRMAHGIYQNQRKGSAPVAARVGTAKKKRMSGWVYGAPSTPLSSMRIVAKGGSSRYVTVWENDPHRLYYHRSDGAMRLGRDGQPVRVAQSVGLGAKGQN